LQSHFGHRVTTTTTSKERKKIILNHYCGNFMQKSFSKNQPKSTLYRFLFAHPLQKSRRKVENCSQKYASLENERWMISD